MVVGGAPGDWGGVWRIRTLIGPFGSQGICGAVVVKLARSIRKPYRTRLKFYLQNSFLEEIWLVLSCGLLHWESWHWRHQEELLGFDRTPRTHLYFRFLSLLHLSLEWTLSVKSFIIFKTAICVSLSSMKNPYSCCCFLPKPHQFPSPPQPSLWSLFSLVWQSLVFRRQWLISAFFPSYLWPEVPFPLLSVRLQRALLTRVVGWVGGCGKLIGQFHFLWGGPPVSLFFFFFFSVFIRGPQVCRSELNEIPESKVSWCYPQTLTWSRLNQDSGASLPLWVFPIAFTVSQDKFIFTNNSNCSSLVPCFGISFSTPSPSHLSNHLCFCDYFALTSGGWTLWT